MTVCHETWYTSLPERLVRLVKATYSIMEQGQEYRNKYGNIDQLNIKIGWHQGSILSPFRFTGILDVITDGFRVGQRVRERSKLSGLDGRMGWD